MANESDVEKTIENEELDLELDTEEAPAEEKPKESPEAKLARLKRQTSQLEKKLGVAEPEPKAKSNDLDYGQKAFLKSYGVQGSDELQLVREYIENGKSLDDIPNNRHFQNDLSELRDARLVKQAVPNGTARSNFNARDSVEYWIAKGEMPPSDNVQLSRDVLNARLKKEKNTNAFSSNPIIEGGNVRH